MSDQKPMSDREGFFIGGIICVILLVAVLGLRGCVEAHNKAETERVARETIDAITGGSADRP